MNIVMSESSTALPLGFEWGAVKAGIKPSGKLDLAVAVALRGGHAEVDFADVAGSELGQVEFVPRRALRPLRVLLRRVRGPVLAD